MPPDWPEHPELFGDLPTSPPPAAASTGRGRRGAVDADAWRAWLADSGIQERYRSLVCWRGDGLCSPFLGSISSSGHGKLRVGHRGDGSRRVVTAHVFGYQLARGLIEATATDDVVLAHACDEPACQTVDHMMLVSRLDNIAQYAARRGTGPLADVRGARGRAVAIRDAILAARANGADVEDAIAAAAAAGLPPSSGTLF